jgi:hypothetical protein
MKFVTRPPFDASNGVGHAGDDLDEVLFAFFRSEMPQPWPAMNRPNRMPPAPPVRPAQPLPVASRRPWFRSPRFALAASVALLIGGSAMMFAVLTPPSQPDGLELNRRTADPRPMWRDVDEELREKDMLKDKGDPPEYLELNEDGTSYNLRLPRPDGPGR